MTGEDDEVVVERGAAPERGDFDEAEAGEDAVEIGRGGVVRGRGFHPEGGLGEEIAGDGDFEAPRIVAQAGADEELAAGGDAGGGEPEQGLLLGGGEKLEDIENADVSEVLGQALARVVVGKREPVGASTAGDTAG